MPSWCKHPERLEVLAKHLETAVDPKHFDMGWWWHPRPDANSPQGNCGTQACAMGHGCNVPELKKLGLFLDRGTFSGTITLRQNEWFYRGFEVPPVLFGISTKDALLLFDDYHADRTPKAMAERIRVFLKDGPEAVGERDLTQLKK